ncbi:MAG: hypothetical protein QOJ29_3821 [Thermoleophilaceae bacterium]|jgi:hypothetical protein|nr:hypothetical protein [Thermoleophilaceae bacterium]
MGSLAELRSQYHAALCTEVLSFGRKRVKGQWIEVYSNADGNNGVSVALAQQMAERLEWQVSSQGLTGQAAGSLFEHHTRDFLEQAFGALAHLRPASWLFTLGKTNLISRFDQYQHLDDIEALVQQHPELHSALGGDYLVMPDIVVAREPLTDQQINKSKATPVLDGDDDATAIYSNLRRANSSRPILHASISCKWTIRSDRAQNTRTEANNLIRNRKGRTPHIAAVTMEPLPSRLASIAMGTGEIDCAYHAALTELLDAAWNLAGQDQYFASAYETLQLLVVGNRLKDISDLPFDLIY